MSRIREVLDNGEGVFRMVPNWVPRRFNEPGHRLRLHPDDIFALGMSRGAICERWIGSITKALNGPETEEFEGLSFVLADAKTGEKILLKDCLDELGADFIGGELYKRYGSWPTFAKLYDYDRPLFHHLHLTNEQAARIGMNGKPEAYYFPVQYNNSYLGRRPMTFFGFDPSTTKEEVKECIRNFGKCDNRITELSKAYRIKVGTGWYTPAGVVHAPASLVTYEPQWNSDVNTILENVTMGEVNPYHLLTDCQPEEEKGDTEAIFDQIDWEENIRPDYKAKYFREPKLKAGSPAGVTEKWITYANEWFSAKEVTLEPGAEAVITDPACYCALFVQGHGKFGVFTCESPELLRYGQISGDEYFVSEAAAKRGIVVKNESEFEPLVFMQNFANNNYEAPQEV